MKKIIAIIIIVFLFGYIFLYKTAYKPSINEKYTIQGDRIDSLAYIIDNDDEVFYFKDLKMPVLIFKYSELNCGVCIDSVVNVVNKLENYQINITYVADYNSKRTMNVFKSINNLNVEIYKTNLISSVDEYNFPYLYIVDEDLVQKSVYIPKKGNLNAFREYLDYIEKFYIKK